MLYWIIPYLLAYNATVPSGWDASEPISWKYGPEHVFNAEVSIVSISSIHDDIDQPYYRIKFVCKPMNLAVIRCRIIWGRRILINQSIADKNFGLDGIIFDIGFNAKGISRVWFLNNDTIFFQNMIRAIIGTMNMGISIADKKVENYVFEEKSVIGTCNTSFIIKNEVLSDVEKKDERQIKGFEFVVHSFGPLADNETIIIEKQRHLRECEKKTPYFFASTPIVDVQTNSESIIWITSSRSQFEFGKRSFSASTKSFGIVEISIDTTLGFSEVFQVNQTIRVDLEAIRPARSDNKIAQHLKYRGAGYEPGFSWPDRTYNQNELFPDYKKT